MTFSAKTSDVQ